MIIIQRATWAVIFSLWDANERSRGLGQQRPVWARDRDVKTKISRPKWLISDDQLVRPSISDSGTELRSHVRPASRHGKTRHLHLWIISTRTRTTATKCCRPSWVVELRRTLHSFIWFFLNYTSWADHESIAHKINPLLSLCESARQTDEFRRWWILLHSDRPLTITIRGHWKRKNRLRPSHQGKRRVFCCVCFV